MILQRLATSIRKQDWFTVVIETLIVVFGVFIGLQVNNWNEARSNAQLEAELQSTLLQDFIEFETQLNDQKEVILLLQNDVSELLGIVRSDVEPADQDRVVKLIDSAWTLPLLPSPPASYTESASAGRLSSLSSPELRRAFSRFTELLTRYALIIPAMRDDIAGKHSTIIQSFKLYNDLEILRQNTNGGIEDYDWSILKQADKDVETTLTWMIVAEFQVIQQLQEVKAIIALLREETAP